MHYIYVLQSQKDHHLYVGCTSDLEKRIKLHNSGAVRSTRPRRPFHIMYSEAFESKYDAYNTERFYKTVKGKAVLKEKMK